MELKKQQIINGNCLEELPKIPTGSIDMILTDLPFQVTACSWDSVIPFDHLWNEYRRVIKDNGAIVLFGTQPFTTALNASAADIFRYELIWVKHQATNPMFAKKGPLKIHENISIFYKNLPTYNPQFEYDKPYGKFKSRIGKKIGEVYSKLDSEHRDNPTGERYPVSLLYFPNPNKGKIHPTQKPVDLCEYLIKTYTNEGDLVLDSCAGGFTTAIAAINTNRQFVCIEKEEKYYRLGKERIENLNNEH